MNFCVKRYTSVASENIWNYMVFLLFNATLNNVSKDYNSYIMYLLIKTKVLVIIA